MRDVRPDHFRSVMGHFATGVTVVTVATPDGPVGLTANAVCSLSLEPLLLLVCFDNERAHAAPAPRDRPLRRQRPLRRPGGPGAAVRVQAPGAGEVRRRSRTRSHDGIPVIEGVLAWVGCRLERLIPGGDHTIGIGSVEAAEAGQGEPLLCFRGGYRG